MNYQKLLYMTLLTLHSALPLQADNSAASNSLVGPAFFVASIAGHALFAKPAPTTEINSATPSAQTMIKDHNRQTELNKHEQALRKATAANSASLATTLHGNNSRPNSLTRSRSTSPTSSTADEDNIRQRPRNSFYLSPSSSEENLQELAAAEAFRPRSASFTSSTDSNNNHDCDNANSAISTLTFDPDTDDTFHNNFNNASMGDSGVFIGRTGTEIPVQEWRKTATQTKIDAAKTTNVLDKTLIYAQARSTLNLASMQPGLTDAESDEIAQEGQTFYQNTLGTVETRLKEQQYRIELFKNTNRCIIDPKWADASEIPKAQNILQRCITASSSSCNFQTIFKGYEDLNQQNKELLIIAIQEKIPNLPNPDQLAQQYLASLSSSSSSAASYHDETAV